MSLSVSRIGVQKLQRMICRLFTVVIFAALLLLQAGCRDPLDVPYPAPPPPELPQESSAS